MPSQVFLWTFYKFSENSYSIQQLLMAPFAKIWKNTEQEKLPTETLNRDLQDIFWSITKQRCIYNPVKYLQQSFFAKPLTVYAKKLYRRCSTGFWIRFCKVSWKKMDPSVLKIGLVDIYLSRRYLQTEICQEPTLRIQLILCPKYVKA